VRSWSSGGSTNIGVDDSLLRTRVGAKTLDVSQYFLEGLLFCCAILLQEVLVGDDDLMGDRREVWWWGEVRERGGGCAEAAEAASAAEAGARLLPRKHDAVEGSGERG
jgi:hypothetical protein